MKMLLSESTDFGLRRLFMSQKRMQGLYKGKAKTKQITLSTWYIIWLVFVLVPVYIHLTVDRAENKNNNDNSTKISRLTVD